MDNGVQSVDYFGQQLVNGITLGGVYALIALGYTLVYGVLQILNFAHGDVYMIGAFIGFFVMVGLGRSPGRSDDLHHVRSVNAWIRLAWNRDREIRISATEKFPSDRTFNQRPGSFTPASKWCAPPFFGIDSIV